ncbi:intradiol ring-cleavage dioxygenase [Pedobacter sp. MC2016-15]|uniref:dioxygenase family protein n=1 Tax=Pedobacter sp. MC2016-15 TaxID=2994473 RepID=UPI002246E274|nr:intradiol ring-cleavage dioxygenase [Pedobacter sp. MC2016-15]MCX2480648.1 intradiol ring-cleavage dioxygenase [Pedobacter sp. MC2016-15]
MERKKFLRSLLIGAMAGPAVLAACSKDEETTVTDPSGTGTVTSTGSSSSSCTVAPTETEGPFPTKVAASYSRSDITDGRTGYKMTAKITINSSCVPLAGAIVDIWHCDAEGNYSEYGGSGMQSTNYQSVHFLRGRQVTDANGIVNFTSIFPGWYSGRATHIHVHVYSSNGNSLKVTQIAFPEGSGTAVALVNGYKKGMTGYTYNANDNVFSDDMLKIEVATVSGSLTDGFALEMKINAA